MSTLSLLEIVNEHTKNCAKCQKGTRCLIGEAYMRPFAQKLISPLVPRRMQAKQTGVGEQGFDGRVSAAR